MADTTSAPSASNSDGAAAPTANDIAAAAASLARLTVQPNSADQPHRFDPEMPFPERIVRAVARYRKKRKWGTQLRCQLFISYMRVGEIDIGSKSHIPGDHPEDDEVYDDCDGYDDQEGYEDPEDEGEEALVKRQEKNFAPQSKRQRELARAELNELGALPQLDEDEDELEVDFVGCVRQFLSTYLMRDSYYYHINAFVEAPGVVQRFLEWLQMHNVCPEYTADIRASLLVCQRASMELPRCKRAISKMPGNFNTLCAAKYGGQLYHAYGGSEDGGASWTDDETQRTFGLTCEQVRMVTDDAFGPVTRVQHSRRTLEVVRVEPFDPSRQHESAGDANAASLPRVGVPHGKIWLREHQAVGHRPGEPWTLGTRAAAAKADDGGDDEDDASLICLHLDPTPANEMLPGMVMTADYHQLSNGLWYVDTIVNLWPSYYLDAQEDEYEEDSEEDFDDNGAWEY
ncbi:Argonaute complex, subunit Arb1 [Thamnocephalis sphaerospora]|uniref:Argonaute complex, subunit Arb1 n=1 Tax=Thamnocephalis sphaerospora TaxID=78915 RepID=A0A4P9XLS8_9FUNG|nr:Argonaute complex, subunit Arb1 [Thamnocephalis sphaerospora]|eukprot:RKP06838.1 Argonaute complex, subunit Arb1 [Thamnocephalis sphaerospora]